MAFDLLGLAGGLLGAFGSGDQEQTSQREPWAPAQPWLKDLITRGQDLQKQYEAQPLSDLQKQAYQNQFATFDNFRNSTAPALTALANKYLTRNGGQGLLDTSSRVSDADAQAARDYAQAVGNDPQKVWQRAQQLGISPDKLDSAFGLLSGTTADWVKASGQPVPGQAKSFGLLDYSSAMPAAAVPSVAKAADPAPRQPGVMTDEEIRLWNLQHAGA